MGLAKQSVLVELNGTLRDLLYPIHEDVSLKIIKINSDIALDVLRHDCAHVMAQAVQELFPGTQVTIGPTIENGFYYDFYRESPFSNNDLEKIEKKMIEIIDSNTLFEREVWSRKNAIKYFKNIGELYKVEIIEDLPLDEDITIYKQGDWVDLCRGPHLPSVDSLAKHLN